MVYSNWFSVNHLYVFPSAQHFVFCKTLIFVCRGCQQKFFGEINQQKLAFDQRVARGANVAVFPSYCLPGALFPLLVGIFPLQPWNTGCLCLKKTTKQKNTTVLKVILTIEVHHATVCRDWTGNTLLCLVVIEGSQQAETTPKSASHQQLWRVTIQEQDIAEVWTGTISEKWGKNYPQVSLKAAKLWWIR